MTDIVDELRDLSGGPSWEMQRIGNAAADTITALRAELEQRAPFTAEEVRQTYTEYDKAMEALRAENARLRAILKNIADHSLELFATGEARAALAQEKKEEADGK